MSRRTLPSPSAPTAAGPIDNRVTASRSRRLRVLLTGRHGNLATSLQWPKVDGLRAGAPEQTEQKSVHARTRNRTCYVRRALTLSLSLSPLSLSVALSSLVFFFIISPLAAPRSLTLPRSERTCRWCLCLVPGPSGLPDRWGRAPEAEVSRWQ